MTGRLMAVDAVDLGRVERYRIDLRIEDLRQELTQSGVAEEQIRQRLAERRSELEQRLRLRRPFLSANDRSRWMAIRALVEQGTFAIDGIYGQPGWDSIDVVQHADRDGVARLYSSKPPLLYTLLAGEYWLIHQATGATLGSHPYTIGRAMLVTINILPMALMMAIAAALAERFFDRLSAAGDWPRLIVVSTAAFGTLLTPFAVVLNNHTVAAVSCAITLYAWARIRIDGQGQPVWFVLAGGAAAFTAANELPALALLVFLAGLLGWRHPQQTMQAFLPAALVVIVAFFATNYAAHESWRPPYMHRSETDPADNWYRYEFEVDGKVRQSYWTQRKGIDRGEPSQATYALHVLAGHHGIFSLTPIWLLSIAGAGYWLAKGRAAEKEMAAITLALTVVCLAFYIGYRPQEDRNYGGMTCGFRWMFWFTPLWLATMSPAVAGLGLSRTGRVFTLCLLAMSAFSTTFPTWNPWTQPWIYQGLEASGWQGF